MQDFPTVLKTWRHRRRLSQLQLANEAEVSPRHLAFLETGRARPSRGMVLRLTDVMGLPRGEQNAVLAAAGFAPQFPALPLADSEMAEVRRAMLWTLERHAPYPALTLDRLWRIVDLNTQARALFGPVGFAEGASLLQAMAVREVFTGIIENWIEVGHHTASRLRAESARAGGVPELDAAVAALLGYPEIATHQPKASHRAVLPTIYRLGGVRLSLFSTYAQFGSAEEVGLSDLKIELMFPADTEAEAQLRGLGG